MTYLLSLLSTYWRGDLVPNPLWLATGALAALGLLAEFRPYRWAVLAGGALGLLAVGSIVFDDSFPAILWPTAGNLVEATVAIILYERALGPVRSHRLASPLLTQHLTQRTMTWVVSAAFAAFIGALIATLSTDSTVIADRLDSIQRWVIGDTLGLLLVPPMVSLGRAPQIRNSTRFGFKEVAWLGAIVTALLGLALSTQRPLEFLLVPTVMWLAGRFGPRLALPVALAVAVATTIEAAAGWGSFKWFPGDAVQNVQILNYSVVFAALIASAANVQARNTHRLLEATLDAMPDLVAVVDEPGGSVGLWGPEPIRALADRLLQRVEQGTPSADGRARVDLDGQLFDGRRAELASGYTMFHFRDISSEVERDRLRRELLGVQEATYRKAALRIAQDLHDGPVQILTAAHLQLELANRKAGTEVPQLQKGVDLVARTIALLRGSITELASQIPRDGELVEAIRSVAAEIFEGTDVAVEVPPGHALPIDDQTATLLYQIAREALVNARLHADATRVVVDVTGSEGKLVLEVRDNGVGVAGHAASHSGHLGVELMRQRAQEAGAELEIGTAPSGGTSVRVTLER